MVPIAFMWFLTKKARRFVVLKKLITKVSSIGKNLFLAICTPSELGITLNFLL